MQEIAIKAETAGRNYFHDHPCADHVTAIKTARNKFTSELERNAFVAGWNIEFWRC